MFCPVCATDDRQRNQFCRVCGADLRAIRNELEGPDPVTAVAVSAREEVCRAIAARIMELESGEELKEVAESVLPAIKKLLRTPEESRLRRIRGGVVVASSGLALGLALVVLAIATSTPDFLGFAAFGLVPFLVGLSLILNGIYFSTSRKILPEGDRAKPAKRLESDKDAVEARRLTTAQPLSMPQSITEHTTHTLGQN